MRACVRACVDAWLKERMDGRTAVLSREVKNDPLCIAVSCFAGTDSPRVQGGTSVLKLEETWSFDRAE